MSSETDADCKGHEPGQEGSGLADAGKREAGRKAAEEAKRAEMVWNMRKSVKSRGSEKTDSHT